MIKQVTQVYFSPGKTTAMIAKEIASTLSPDTSAIDLLKKKPIPDKVFAADDLVVFALPVFSGRIPEICVRRMEGLRGNNTPAVAVVVYGNRNYDDALLELADLLEEKGFRTIGAGAFVARHSIFPDVAKGRPDHEDIEEIRDFASRCGKKADLALTADGKPLSVKGNRPYREVSPLPLKPSGNSACTKCGVCASICPVNAIDAANPRKTDKEKCISCTACIYACPHHARNFRGIKYRLASKMFGRNFDARQKPDLFY